MIRTIHPFPARMAPELAVAELRNLTSASVVLDPMSGSGTVLREAVELGHHAIGFDMDPLAVLMAKVWSTPVTGCSISDLAAEIIQDARQLNPDNLILPWIDNDPETQAFVNFWFASQQKNDLRCLAFLLSRLKREATSHEANTVADALFLALSRIIITKENGASLARDVSHSRPHKVAQTSDYKVFAGFEKSVQTLLQRLTESPSPCAARVGLGDARRLTAVDNHSVDVVLTSPPYLNAIDYLRGHRLSLVWMGHRLSELRAIRTASIGAECGPDDKAAAANFAEIQKAMGEVEKLPKRHASMIARYAQDIYKLLTEVARVLRATGRAIFVVGNSCLKGIFIKNSDAVGKAAIMNGLKITSNTERELPVQSRYLPILAGDNNPLSKRMRTETILTLAHA